MEKNKQQILAELYAIRAGLSIISMEKDKIVKSEKSVKKHYDEIIKINTQVESENKQLQSNIATVKRMETGKKIERKQGISQIPLVAGCGALLGLILGFFLSIIPYEIYYGNWGAYLISLLIFILIGSLIGYICGVKADKNEQLKIEEEYKREVSEYNKDLKKANEQVKNVEKQVVKLNTNLNEQKNDYNTQLTIYNDVKTIVLSTADVLYNSLVEQFNGTLDCRDWKNIDLIIFYYETGRADTLKEALIQVDRQRQNDALIKAIKDASDNICQTIQRSINELRADINNCFNSLSIQLTNQHNEQMKVLGNISSSLLELKKLAIKIDETIIEGNNEMEKIVSSNLKQITTQQALNNALIEKISLNSTRLVDDVNYVVNYQTPAYIA